MGALRHPERPSSPLEPLHPPLDPAPSAQSPPLGRRFIFGACGAVFGATLLVVGAATASAATIWTAVAVVALAALALKSSIKSTPRPSIFRD